MSVSVRPLRPSRRAAAWCRAVVPSLAACCGLLPLTAVEAPVDADAPIVVTAGRLPEAADATVQPVDRLDADDERAAGYPFQPIDLVADLPGAFQTRNGGIAGLGGLRLRGAPSYGTLVLFDGVPLHDAAGPQNAPDLTVLNPAGIAATEVVRGPQSGLYGSRAIGGVVDFRPLRPSDEHAGFARLQGGSFQTVDALVQATGPLGDATGYAAGVSATRSEGLSNQTSDADGDPLDHEEDGLERLGGYGRVEHRLAPGATLFAAIDSLRAETEFDGFGAPDDDDPVTEYDVHRLHLGARLDDAAEDRFRLAADLAYTSYERALPEATAFSNDFEAGDLYASVHGHWRITDLLAIGGGADYRREEAEITAVGGSTDLDADADHLGLWLRGALDAEDYAVAATLRREEHSEEGDATTWQLAARLDLFADRLELHALGGTTFRAPSLFEQFAPADPFFGPVGNDTLEPEEGYGFAVGHRTRLGPQVVLGNTWFRTAFDERIDFIFGGGFENTDRSERIDGLETELLIEPHPDAPVAVAIRHTWQDFDHADGLERRLPENVLRSGVTWHAPHDVRAGFHITAVDERSDGGATLAAYTLVGVAASWRIDARWEVFARGDNLTDADYELVDGFATPGRSGQIGASARW